MRPGNSVPIVSATPSRPLPSTAGRAWCWTSAGVTAEALSLKTAKLPSVAMAPPERVIGKGTVDSIQSGLFYGYLGLIEGVTRRILDELGEATVVATGGLAGAFASETDLIHHVEPDLTLHGLRLLWALNQGETA